MKKAKGLPYLAAAVAVVVTLWFFAAVGQLRSDSAEEGRRQLETALRRGAVACYAAEGIYPPNIAYLTEHYGIQVDESRYAVFYEVFAENLMPQITVLQRGT